MQGEADMPFRYVAGIALLLAANACATMPAPVPLVADPEGKLLLAGNWVGEYWNPATGRSGSISFSLVQHDTTQCNVHAEHAHGDVLMVPLGGEALPPAEGWEIGRAEREAPTVLRIQLIRVRGERLTGTLEPYRDPDTGNAVSTTFEGIINGDEIRGDFVSVDARTGQRFMGNWRVLRTSKPVVGTR
jgi:hypothetical protein